MNGNLSNFNHKQWTVRMYIVLIRIRLDNWSKERSADEHQWRVGARLRSAACPIFIEAVNFQ